jgi:hypothetical protein
MSTVEMTAEEKKILFRILLFIDNISSRKLMGIYEIGIIFIPANVTSIDPESRCNLTFKSY